MARAPRPALKRSLARALGAVAAVLREGPMPGMVIGGIAVIAHGVPRLTRDIDCTVPAEAWTPRVFAERAAGHELVPRIEDAIAFAERHHVLLLRHVPSGVDVDATFGWLPYEHQALADAVERVVGGVRTRVVRVEDLIVYKAIAFRPQDRQDIERLLEVHGRTLDLGHVRAAVATFAEALEVPERVAEVEALLARVVGR